MRSSRRALAAAKRRPPDRLGALDRPSDPHEAPTVAIGSGELVQLVAEDMPTVVAGAIDPDATVVAAPIVVVDVVSAPTNIVPEPNVVVAEDDGTRIGMVPLPIVPREVPAADPMATIPPDSPMGPVDDTTPCELADRYEIRALLGTGTFARVFSAIDRKLNRPVALKVLHAHHRGEIRQRFFQEAHITSGIEHPGIVSVLDTGETKAGTAFIVMELLRGESLQDRIDRIGPLPSAAVIEIGRQVAAALAAAHAVSVIHRDLKPENIFLVPDPAAAAGERVKVFDFGLAKPRHSPLTTSIASMFGTPAYMSPEQCRSSADIDHRADIYSLGCCLFHIAAGRPPFQGTMLEIVKAHESVIPPRLSSIVRGIDPWLDSLVRSMLAKRLTERPSTMKQVERALSTMGMPVSAARVVDAPPHEPLRQWLPHVVAAIITGVLVLVAIVAIVVLG